MSNSENQFVHIYQNKNWTEFQSIGSFEIKYGSMGMEIITFKMPEENLASINWKEINQILTPTDILFHLWRISNDLKSAEIIKMYGESLYNKFKKQKSEIAQINSLLMDDMDCFKDENILIVNPGCSINYVEEFDWSANNEWARRDPDFVALFCENWQNQPTIFINSEIYSDLTELVSKTWLKLTSN